VPIAPCFTGLEHRASTSMVAIAGQPYQEHPRTLTFLRFFVTFEEPLHIILPMALIWPKPERRWERTLQANTLRPKDLDEHGRKKWAAFCQIIAEGLVSLAQDRVKAREEPSAPLPREDSTQ